MGARSFRGTPQARLFLSFVSLSCAVGAGAPGRSRPSVPRCVCRTTFKGSVLEKAAGGGGWGGWFMGDPDGQRVVVNNWGFTELGSLRGRRSERRNLAFRPHCAPDAAGRRGGGGWREDRAWAFGAAAGLSPARGRLCQENACGLRGDEGGVICWGCAFGVIEHYDSQPAEPF